MPKILKEKIAYAEKVAPLVYRIGIESEFISRGAKPGQFVAVKCGEETGLVLRRPLSICLADKSNGIFDIAFMLRGKGTAILSQKRPGDVLDLIGPLGTSFDTSGTYGKIAVVGGGIGIFPLLFLLNEIKASEKAAFLGFRDKNGIIFEKHFRDASDRLLISTEDGSAGFKGLVTDLLEKDMQTGNAYDIIYACGPVPMLKKIKDFAENNGAKCQVSLEQRMGCGIGACRGCACKVKTSGGWEYGRVCKDGPVFWSGDIILEDG